MIKTLKRIVQVPPSSEYFLTNVIEEIFLRSRKIRDHSMVKSKAYSLSVYRRVSIVSGGKCLPIIASRVVAGSADYGDKHFACYVTSIDRLIGSSGENNSRYLPRLSPR